MKITKFLAMAVAAVAMLSCNKSTQVGPGNGEEIGEPTYTTFKLNIAGQTMAAGDYNPADAEVGVADEQKVGTIQMLIFSAGSGALEFNEVVTGSNTKTVLLTAGRKKIIFLANHDKLTALLTGVNPETFKIGTGTMNALKGLAFDAGITQPVGTDVMDNRTFNFKNLYDLSAAGVGRPMSTSNEITYIIKPGVSEADSKKMESTSETGESANNNFTIQLDFMVAKASLKVNPGVLNTTDKAKPVITDVKFAVRNLPKWTSFVQNVPLAGQVPQSYYYNHTWADAAAYAAEFDAASTPSVPVTETQSQYVFILENNAPNINRGQSSYFIIQATYKPAQLITKVEHDLDNKVKYIYTDFGDITPAQAGYVYTLADIAGVATGTYFATLALLEEAVWISTFDKTFTAANRDEAKGLVNETQYATFATTTSFYRLDIGDGNGSDTKLGVLRGNQYNAMVTKITGPGVPSQEDLVTDPEEPVSSKTYITATIKAAEWNTITQEGEL